MAQSLKLMKHLGFNARLVCKSGTRIGGTESEIGIGSAENPIIKDASGKPYVPGSSLKGKMRSLLEYKYNRVEEDGSPCKCGQPLDVCPVCTIFGPHRNNKHQLGPSRIIVRDAFLTEKSLEDWNAARDEGRDFSEIKMETSIDRRTGMAAHGSLRQQERVNPGTEFQIVLSLRILEGDNENRMVELIKEALGLLNNDYLGSSGTRGYGWVEIKDIEVKEL